jgi:hypothetical protein
MAYGKNDNDRKAPVADLMVLGVPVYGSTRSAAMADAIAISGSRVLDVGRTGELERFRGADTRVIEPRRGCVIPGMIDGHAHMDREGLKSILPSLDGAKTKKAVVDLIHREAARKKPGEWIVTMPIGTAPGYETTREFDDEGYPDRRDLDQAAPDNPVYIRPIWGYWRASMPLVSIANSRALEMAGIDRNTLPPTKDVEIVRDPGSGEPTGVFYEHTMMPIVELTLLACAPNFSLDDRRLGLQRSMRVYNSFGTTAVYEGHGVASDVIDVYRQLAMRDQLSVRSNLVISPGWSGTRDATAAECLQDISRWLARRGYSNRLLTVDGLYAEIDEEKANWVRAPAAPQTGWAGFHYDSGLPRRALKEVLLEVARSGMRASCIFADVAEVYEEVHREVPIDQLRWSWGHLSTMTEDDVARALDLGLIMVTHTNRHIRKMGSIHRRRLGKENEDQIVPLRRLMDAGIPVSFGTDNLPPSLFHPIYHAIARRDQSSGEVVAPGQKISREEALHCATWSGAYLVGQETELGTLDPGKNADLAILNDDLMSVAEEEIPGLCADATIVDGRIVWERTPDPDLNTGIESPS